MMYMTKYTLCMYIDENMPACNIGTYRCKARVGKCLTVSRHQGPKLTVNLSAGVQGAIFPDNKPTPPTPPQFQIEVVRDT